MCTKELQMFYDSAVAGVLFHAIVCWGGASKAKELTKMIKKALALSRVCSWTH